MDRTGKISQLKTRLPESERQQAEPHTNRKKINRTMCGLRKIALPRVGTPPTNGTSYRSAVITFPRTMYNTKGKNW